jgi:DNA-binding transcriptional ArsR family regulator
MPRDRSSAERVIHPVHVELCGLLPQFVGELIPAQPPVTTLGVERGEERGEIENRQSCHARQDSTTDGGGAIASGLSMSQPQVSKHLRVLSEVGLVSCRAEGRRRLYRLEPAPLQPMHEWLTKYERALHERLDRLDDYLRDRQGRE